MFDDLVAWYKRHSDSTNLEIEESSTGLLIRCRVRSGPISKGLSGSFFVLWTLFAWHMGGWPWFLMGLVATGSWYWYSRQPVAVDATISGKGIETVGNFGGGYDPLRQMMWGDIVRLEYSGGTGGEDEAYSPAGLWAIGKGFRSCVVPGLDRGEAEALIEKIYERFHDVTMAVDAGYSGLFKDDLVSLNLSGREH